MSKRKILLADNIASFRDTCAEYLKLYGYDVEQVATPEECQRVLEEGLAHLAILDIRMRDDNDEADVSGLDLARQCNPHLPKIILTAFPTWEKAREALRLNEDELPPAVDFASKLEGLENLRQRVERAFDEYVRVNWDLEIVWRRRDCYALIELLEPGLEKECRAQYAEELEDLFRRLFADAARIKIDELLWQREHRLALEVFSFAPDKLPEATLVVCGRNAEVKEKTRRYRAYAPKSPPTKATTLHLTATATHFAANAYALAGCAFENVRALDELYRADTGRSFSAALTTLYEQTLAAWRQEHRVLAEEQTLEACYRAQLDLTPAQFDEAELAARLRALARLFPTLGCKLHWGDQAITWQFTSASFTYPDPTPLVYRNTTIGHPVLLINTPGALLGDNLLTNPHDQVWLTDFARAGLAPLLWNYVTLEAALRFDWLEPHPLQHLHELEQCLTATDFSHFELSDVAQPLRKPLRAVQQIRRLALGEAGADVRSYHLGIFFHAVSRLAYAAPTATLTKNELTRLAHLLMSAAMAAQLLVQSDSPPLPLPATANLHLDDDRQGVWISGRFVRLTEQGFTLFRYLHNRANQLCTRREIVEQVFGYTYDEQDESQEALVNTAISRLRAELKLTAQSSHYIRNERGRGYRLVLDSITAPEH